MTVRPDRSASDSGTPGPTTTPLRALVRTPATPIGAGNPKLPSNCFFDGCSRTRQHGAVRDGRLEGVRVYHSRQRRAPRLRGARSRRPADPQGDRRTRRAPAGGHASPPRYYVRHFFHASVADPRNRWTHSWTPTVRARATSAGSSTSFGGSNCRRPTSLRSRSMTTATVSTPTAGSSRARTVASPDLLERENADSSRA